MSNQRRLRVASMPTHAVEQRAAMPILATVQGITVPAVNVTVVTDWQSIQSLYESGLPVSSLAKHYKMSERHIKKRAADEKWLRPSDVEKLRREIERHQKNVFEKTGAAAPVAKVKAEILKERREKLKETQLGIVEKAFEEASKDDRLAKKLIQSSKGFMEMVQAGRLITGEEAEEQAKKGGMAINIGLLRSGPRDAPIIDVTPNPSAGAIEGE